MSINLYICMGKIRKQAKSELNYRKHGILKIMGIGVHNHMELDSASNCTLYGEN